MEFLQSVDEKAVLYTAKHLRSGFLNVVMIIITTLGNAGAIWLAACAVLMLFKKHRRRVLVIVMCITVCTLVNTLIIKNLVARVRPLVKLTELTVLVKPQDEYSFPSGHSAVSFAAAYAFTHCYKRRGALTFIPAALIAVSRVYVGVHYPSDIIVGAIIGVLCSKAVCTVMEKRFAKSNIESGEAPLF